MVVVIVKGGLYLCVMFTTVFSQFTPVLTTLQMQVERLPLSDSMGIFYFDKLKRITKTLWQQNGTDMSDCAYDFLSWSVSIKKSISWGTL